MSASRTERLLALSLVLLNSERPLSRSEIREAVRDYPTTVSQDAFERMFERDKDELRAMGLPIESVKTTEHEGIGYLLKHSDAFLTPIEADEPERMALAIASRIWQEATWSHAATTALRKLELVGGFDVRVDLAYNVSVKVDSAALTALLGAATEARNVSFDYRSASDADLHTRHLQPWGVVAARGQWYVVGHDMDRNATRAFRLSRIVGKVSVKRSSGAYSIPTDVDLRDLVLTTFVASSTVDVEALLAPGRAARLRLLATDIDGDRAVISNVDQTTILSDLLRAGPDVTVLGPEPLRNAVSSALTRLSSARSRPVTNSERALLAAQQKKTHSNPIESSTEQLGRLLALVPWLRAHPGVTYQQAAEHFGVDVARLQKDIELAVCTEFGNNLLTLDIDAWGSTINVRDPQGILAPLRFTESEGISLLVGLDLLTQLPGPHDLAAVASVSDKLRAAIGAAAGITQRLSVDGATTADSAQVVQFRSDLQRILESRSAVELDYLSVARDLVTNRIVDPMGLLTTSGVTYLQGWCRSAEAVRLFRLDRIQALTELPEAAAVPEHAGPLLDEIDPAGEVAVFEVDPSLQWWVDHVPHDATISTDDGRILVQLRISSREWAVRTALGFGGELSILEPESAADEVRARAHAALAHYPE